ncbi:MAG: penicillin-binding protein 2 [Firmicutes bacterium]|nr:penicillin-binding protein 2 [Bacillota bacterium]
MKNRSTSDRSSRSMASSRHMDSQDPTELRSNMEDRSNMSSSRQSTDSSHRPTDSSHRPTDSSRRSTDSSRQSTDSSHRSTDSSHPADSENHRRRTTRSARRISSEQRKGNPRSFATIKHLYLFLAALMILFLTKTMLIDGSKIRVNTYNPRLANAEEHYIRGSIYDASGNLLAYTKVESDGTKTRVYPFGETYAHVTGYSLRSKTCMELVLNEKLLSSDRFTDQLEYLFGGDDIRGNNAILTIDGGLQQKAYELLKNVHGAVVISEPSTGKILALVSTPAYDPNTVSEEWEDLTNRDDSPLYSRAMQGQYPPGSTFKIITSLAAYRDGSLRNYEYDCEGEVEIGRTTLPCYHSTAHGEQDIYDAFANSCNTYFATLGLRIGGDDLRKTADSLHLNDRIDFVLPQSMSHVIVSDADNEQMIAETAIGQGQNQITPFSMNMIAAAIGNRGMLYRPYIVDRIENAEGKTVEKYLPAMYDSAVMTTDEADFLEQLMDGVIAYGTAYMLNDLPCDVYGKTGTAQIAEGDDTEPHSWFTGYTKVGGKTGIAITVMIENGAESYPALPIVHDLLDYYYTR